MKNLLNISLTLFFTAIIVLGFALPVNPPGWYQQPLPVNDQINDIYFINAQTGWITTDGRNSPPDTGYIFKTTDGGTSWAINLLQVDKLGEIQFINDNTGYCVLGWNTARVLKTTNAGINWFETGNLGVGFNLTDLKFINKDTGWTCSNFTIGGLWKTTDGGFNWQIQLNPTYNSYKLHALNRDTVFMVNSGANGQLYRTTNGGMNWGLQYTFTQQLNDIYFFNPLKGIITSGFNYYTTNGGFNWTLSNDGGIKISMVNDTIGWAGSNFNKIMKTTNGGINWFRQYSPIFDNSSVFGLTINNAWAGGTGLVYTTDGGGPPLSIIVINQEIPDDFKLFQNYPNPFNPETKIRFQFAKSGFVEIKIYNTAGKEIISLINKNLISGEYIIDWNASEYPSGIYFYTLIVNGSPVNTKSMVLLK